MGINVILPLIIGIGLMLSIGTTIAPSIIEDMKISKIENRTIENQEIIKNAIIRYIQIEEKAPVDMNDLKNSNLLKDYHNDNLFNQGYTFEINSKKGYIKIKTKIDDNGAMKYFENNIKYPNKPNCITMINNICQNNEFETFYLVDNDIHDILLKNVKVKYTDLEYLDNFVEGNIGQKDEHLKNPPKDGDKDFVIKGPNTIIEYVYNEVSDTWVKESEKTVGGIGADTGVEIKDISWSFVDGLGDTIEQKHEKVVCNTTSINKEVFVINQNTGLGEIVWVAPTTNYAIRTKIFGVDNLTIRQTATNIVGSGTNDLKYNPNNICTSNVTSMYYMFGSAYNFDQRLNRWDTSNVTSMERVFNDAKKFNQELNFWDTSNVITMEGMFSGATIFNQLIIFDTSNVTSMKHMFNYVERFDQPLNFDTSSVANMESMFRNTGDFDQPLNFDTSNVKNMESMFYYVEKFNQPLNNWDTSKVTNMAHMFSGAEIFNQNISSWCVSLEEYQIAANFSLYSPLQALPNFRPKWGKAKVIETIDGRNSKCQIEQDNGTCNIYDLINQNSLINSNVTCQ